MYSLYTGTRGRSRHDRPWQKSIMMFYNSLPFRKVDTTATIFVSTVVAATYDAKPTLQGVSKFNRLWRKELRRRCRFVMGIARCVA